jgi:DNA-binding IclR family transcriptional regulator
MYQNMKHSSDKLNSVEKALSILLTFDAQRPIWGVRELSSQLGFSPATVQRLLQSLKAFGFVVQAAETRQYRLGNVYYNFLHTLQSTLPVTHAALPRMKQLLAITQETVHLNVIDGLERLCVDTLESPQSLKASMPIGSRSPLYAGASSKCLLAYAAEEFRHNYLETVQLTPITEVTITDKQRLLKELQKTRQKSCAESLSERTTGLGSLSVPIFNHRGTLLAALSLAIPETRYRDKTHRKHCMVNLCRIGQELSSIMGYHA